MGITKENVNITAANVGTAATSHTHGASNISSEILPTSRRGTGNSTGYVTVGQKSGTTLGSSSTAEGFCNTASGDMSHAEGQATTASGENSHAEGYKTTASGGVSHASVDNTIASSGSQFVCGQYNTEYKSSRAYVHHTSAMFIVGKGNATGRTNCFRVGFTEVWSGKYNSTGADYAEYFEWFDGNPDNEDRRGLFVTLEGDKIKVATPNDGFILGIVSGNPSIVGDSHDDQWNKMYVSDIFGTPVYEDVEVPAEIDGDGNIIVEAHTKTRQKMNPDYDNSQKYKPRSERPEWDAVGMMGKLVEVDDGTCQVNGYCGIGNGGIAVHSGEPTKFRVMKRLDNRHIQVLVI